MKTEQVQKLKTAQVSPGTIETHKAHWEGIPGFVEAVDAAQALTDRILKCSRTQSAHALSGEGEGKTAARRDMLKRAFLICSALKSCAAASENAVLAAQVNFSRSRFARGDETEVLNRCQAILDLATANATVLAGQFNTSANDLKAAKTALQAFTDAKPRPRLSTTVSAAATTELVEVFAELDEVWRKRVDPLMEKFKETEPSFYNEYQSARVVVDAPGTREGKTPDAGKGATGTGVAKAA